MPLAETGIRYIIDPTQAEAGARRVNQSLTGITENAFRQAARQNMILQRLPQRYIFLGMDLQQTAMTMSAAITVPFTIASTAALKFASDFQTSMRDVNSIAQLSEAEFAALSQSLLEMAASPTILAGPIELSKGLYQMYSSGLKGTEALTTLQIASEGATAGMTDVDTAARATVGVVNAYGESVITAQQAMDVMFRTVDLGILRFSDLAQGIGTVLAPAARAGISFGEIGAALVSMTRAGIPPAEAMTYLTRAIESIIDPSKEAIKLAEELGIGWDITTLRTQGFIKTLLDMETATNGNERSMATLIGEQRASRAVFSILRDGAKEYTSALAQMKEAQTVGGDTARALEQQLKAPGAAAAKLKSDAEQLGISFGETLIPALQLGISTLRDLLDMFRQLPSEVQLAAFAFTGLTATLGPLLLVGSRLVMAYGTVWNAIITYATRARDATRVAAEAAAALQLILDSLHTQGFARVAPDLLQDVVLAQRAVAQETAGTIAARAAVEAQAKAELRLALALANRSEAEFGAALAALREAQGNYSALTTTQALTIAEVQAARGATSRAIAEMEAVGAARAATTATMGLGTALTALTVVGAAAALAVITENMVQEREAARLAAMSASELVQEYNDLADARKRMEGVYTGGGGYAVARQPFALNPPSMTMRNIKDLIGVVPEDVQRAIAQIKQVMVEGEEELAATWESKVQGLRNIMAKAIELDDPDMLRRAGDAFGRLIDEGTSAADRAAIEKVPYTARKAILEWVQSWEDAAKMATPEMRRTIEQAIDSALADIGGRAALKVTVPVTLEAVVDPSQVQAEQNLADARKKLAAETAGLEGEERWWQTNLDYVNQKLQENKYALEDAQDAVSDAQKAVSSLSSALSDAKDRLQNWSHPVLIGMRELDDKIFETQMGLAGLQLQLLQVNAQFDPLIAQAEKNVLEARLAYLLLGETAQEAGKKGSQAIFDLAEAQRRELETGVPVAMQYAEWLKNRPVERREGESQPEANLREAERQLEIAQILKQLAAWEAQTKYNELQNTEQILENEKKITFEGKLRKLEQMADTRVPVTYEEAVAQVEKALADINTLNQQLAGANAALEGRKSVVEGLERKQRDLNREQDTYQQKLNDTKKAIEKLAEAYDPIIKQFEKIIADYEKLKTAPTIDLNINPPDPVTVTVEVKTKWAEAQGLIARKFEGGGGGGEPTQPQAGPNFWDPFTKLMEPFLDFISGKSRGFEPWTTNPISEAEGGIVPGKPGEPRVIIAEGGERFMGNPGPDRDTWNVTQYNYGSNTNTIRELQRVVTLKRMTRRKGRRL